MKSINHISFINGRQTHFRSLLIATLFHPTCLLPPPHTHTHTQSLLACTRQDCDLTLILCGLTFKKRATLLNPPSLAPPNHPLPSQTPWRCHRTVLLDFVMSIQE